MPDSSRDVSASMATPCELTVMMPCLDEAETIGICVKKARDFIDSRNIDGEVLVADNGSTDGSREIAESLGARMVAVAHKEHAQDVERIVERLKPEGSQQRVSHVSGFRPCGSYQGLAAGDGFQVKHPSVEPGAQAVPSCTIGACTIGAPSPGLWCAARRGWRAGKDFRFVQADESTYIAPRPAHRLENPGSEPLSVIEIQSGDYLGEENIARFDDVCGRGDDWLGTIGWGRLARQHRNTIPENLELY